VIGGLIEMGRRCGMEMNVEETRVMRISRQPSPIQIMIDQKQLKSVKYFNCLVSMITNDAKCTHEIKCRKAMAKAALNKKSILPDNWT
jgi:hypothetical protein